MSRSEDSTLDVATAVARAEHAANIAIYWHKPEENGWTLYVAADGSVLKAATPIPSAAVEAIFSLVLTPENMKDANVLTRALLATLPRCRGHVPSLSGIGSGPECNMLRGHVGRCGYLLDRVDGLLAIAAAATKGR